MFYYARKLNVDKLQSVVQVYIMLSTESMRKAMFASYLREQSRRPDIWELIDEEDNEAHYLFVIGGDDNIPMYYPETTMFITRTEKTYEMRVNSEIYDIADDGYPGVVSARKWPTFTISRPDERIPHDANMEEIGLQMCRIFADEIVNITVEYATPYLLPMTDSAEMLPTE